jgi:hypothetical protein
MCRFYRHFKEAGVEDVRLNVARVQTATSWLSGYNSAFSCQSLLESVVYAFSRQSRVQGRAGLFCGVQTTMSLTPDVLVVLPYKYCVRCSGSIVSSLSREEA